VLVEMAAMEPEERQHAHEQQERHVQRDDAGDGVQEVEGGVLSELVRGE